MQEKQNKISETINADAVKLNKTSKNHQYNNPCNGAAYLWFIKAPSLDIRAQVAYLVIVLPYQTTIGCLQLTNMSEISNHNETFPFQDTGHGETETGLVSMETDRPLCMLPTKFKIIEYTNPCYDFVAAAHSPKMFEKHIVK